jgi:hypothetical protein
MIKDKEAKTASLFLERKLTMVCPQTWQPLLPS